MDGEICIRNSCFRCCLDTEMPLTLEDIRRIVRLGYKLDEFAVFKDGLWRLRNVGGRCVFLDSSGRCKIYKHRPEGCRLYPVIEIDGGCEVDMEVCPYAHMISIDEFEEACRRVLELNRKLRELSKNIEYINIREALKPND